MWETELAQAQELLWSVEQLRRLGALHRARRKLLALGKLHLDLARRRLDGGDPGGWIDLYAGLSALGEAGEKHRAREALAEAGRRAETLPREDRENIERELREHEKWLKELVVLPSLSELGASLPVPIPHLAA